MTQISSLNKGLVLHQELNKQSSQGGMLLKDSTPYENQGTKYGSVLKFLGTDSNYVDCGSDSSHDITTAITVSMWVKTSSEASQYFLAKDDGVNRNYILQYSSSSKTARFVFWRNTNIKIADSNINIADGKWHHIVGTFDGTTSKAYVDGISGTDLVTPGEIISNDINLYIGSMVGGGNYSNGSIGETRIYSRALSAAEVNTLYHGGIVSDTDLVAHYKMKDKSGTTLTDETGNNNGTLTNFADTTAEYGDTHTSGWTTNDTPIVYGLDRKGNDNGISFDGASDYVDCGNDSSLNITTTTVSIWFNANISNKTIMSRDWNLWRIYNNPVNIYNVRDGSNSNWPTEWRWKIRKLKRSFRCLIIYFQFKLWI